MKEFFLHWRTPLLQWHNRKIQTNHQLKLCLKTQGLRVYLPTSQKGMNERKAFLSFIFKYIYIQVKKHPVTRLDSQGVCYRAKHKCKNVEQSFEFEFGIMHSVWKSQRKSHSTLKAKLAMFTFWEWTKVNKKWQK